MAQGSATKAEAFLLAAIGGCVDAVGILTLGGLFVSHMSGNTASFGAAFGQGDWIAAWPHLFAVPVFVLGLFLGYLCVAERSSYRRCALIFLVEAVLLTVFAAALFAAGGSWSATTPGYFLLVVPPLLAMGLQNATLRQIGRSVFPSTYVTGVLDMLAKSAAEYWIERGRPGAQSKGVNALNAAGIWFSYALGAIGGGWGTVALRPGVLLVPIAVLLVLALKFFLRKDVPAVSG